MHTSYGGYGRKQETSGKVISHPVVKIVKFCPVGVSKKSFAFFVKVLSLFWKFILSLSKNFWEKSDNFLDKLPKFFWYYQCLTKISEKFSRKFHKIDNNETLPEISWIPEKCFSSWSVLCLSWHFYVHGYSKSNVLYACNFYKIHILRQKKVSHF